MSTRTVIMKEEGWRARPYYCSENYPTIGYGFKLGGQNFPLPSFEITKATGEVWLKELLTDYEAHYSQYAYYNQLNEPRRAILLSMAYQIGKGGLAKFKGMLKGLELGDFDIVADEMLDSLWARQTPQRANRHALQMREGCWIKYYTD